MKTDSQMQQDVGAASQCEPAVHSLNIGAEFKADGVTLAGERSSHTEKWIAERVAQRVSGTNALAVELKLKVPGSARRTDADMTRVAHSVHRFSGVTDLGDPIATKPQHGMSAVEGELPASSKQSTARATPSHTERKAT